MKRFGTALAVALVALCVTAGCNDYGNTFQGNTGASLTSLSPGRVNAVEPGSPDLTILVIGQGFVNTCKSGITNPSCATVVQWNGKTIDTTTTVDSNTGSVTSVKARVPATLLTTPGRAFVNTLNPKTSNQDNGLSNTIAFLIDIKANPQPTITSISPNIAAPGSPDLALTVSGSNYIQNTATNCATPNGSILQWTSGGVTNCLNPSATSASSLTATVPAALLAAQACAVVTVFTPPAVDPNDSGANGGGGASPLGQTFTISTNANFCPAASMSQAANGTALVAEETPAVSLDGRFVAYTGQQGKTSQIFLRDTCEGAASGCTPQTTMLSAATDSSEGNGDSHNPSISSDGRYIAFSSSATNLVSETPSGKQIFLRDTCHGADASCKPQTQIVSVDPGGQLSATDNLLPSISASGRYIAFLSVKSATTKTQSGRANSPNQPNNANQMNNGIRQVFVRDTCIGATGSCTPKTMRISSQPGDANSIGGKPSGPAISGSGSGVGIADNHSATLFTRSVAVDDRVFLALTKEQK